MSTNPRTFRGKPLDDTLLSIVEAATDEDNQTISWEVAKQLLVDLKEDGEYDMTEKRTLRFIRGRYNFDARARALFNRNLLAWRAELQAD